MKLNYFEVAALTEGQVCKDGCKVAVEAMVRKFAEQARRGTVLDEEIPHVGRLQIKNRVAGVIFKRELLEETRG